MRFRGPVVDCHGWQCSFDSGKFIPSNTLEIDLRNNKRVNVEGIRSQDVIIGSIGDVSTLSPAFSPEAQSPTPSVTTLAASAPMMSTTSITPIETTTSQPSTLLPMLENTQQSSTHPTKFSTYTTQSSAHTAQFSPHTTQSTPTTRMSSPSIAQATTSSVSPSRPRGRTLSRSTGRWSSVQGKTSCDKTL